MEYVKKNIVRKVISIYSIVICFSCNNSNTTNSIDSLKNKVKDTVFAAPIKSPTPDDIFADIPINYDSTKKYIYLTFDDGPQPGTEACVNVCKKLGVKATFFMVGNHASSPYLLKQVNDIKYSYPLLLLANHSTTHANGRYHYFYSHPNMALNDFLQAQKKLSVPYKIIRLPGNTSWVRKKGIKVYNKETYGVCKLLDSCGYNVFGWDVEWNFNRKTANPVQSAEKLHRTIVNRLNENNLMEKNHLVILTHDRMFRSANYTDSLSKFITLLKQDTNYVFETMDHYPNIKN